MPHPAAVIVAATLLLGAPTRAYAQTPDLAELSLTDLLSTRAVTGARHDQRLVDSPRAITVITAEDIRRRNYRSTPEALTEAVGVFVQQTNDGGGAPIIRGLVGHQVLILIDGIRLNNAAFRLGPNQHLNTIDINQVDRIEIVRGPGSVLYGSDALGGVVNIITRSPAEGAGRAMSTRFFSRFSSANTGAVGRAEVSARGGAFSFLGGASGKQFNALRGGHDTGVQPLTGYTEWDSDAKLGVALSANQRLTVAAQRVRQHGMQRPDAVLAGADLRMAWDPQARTLVYAQYSAREVRGHATQVNVTTSFQRQSERFTRVTVGAPSIERQHFDRTDSLGASVQLTSAHGPRHLLTYGADAARDDLTSRRSDVSLVTGERRSAPGLLADGSDYQSWALFIQDEIDISSRIHLNLGARYSAYYAEATVANASTGEVRIDSRQRALTGTAYGLFRLTPNVELVGGIAQGFRAPNIDDLTILSSFGGGFEVPSPGLRPETSVNVEAGVRGRSRRATGGVTYFLSDFRGLIQRQAGLFLGQPFLDLNDSGARDVGEPLVFQRQNLGEAWIHGIEIEGQSRVSSHWVASGTLARIAGEETSAREPLRRMPPTHGTAKLAWAPGGRAWVEGYSLFATRQTRLSPGDLGDVRIPDGGTRGFVILSVRGGLTIIEGLAVTWGVENLTNRTYRIHGSGIDMAGTNVVLGMGWTF